MSKIKASKLLHVFAAANPQLLCDMLQAVAVIQANIQKEVNVSKLCSNPFPQDLYDLLQNLQLVSTVQALTAKVLADYAD